MTALPAPRAGASAAAIQRHYDVGNSFYRCMLDAELTYSCALFEPGEGIDALDTAQLRKLDLHAEQARATGARRVLDIGCGWGSALRRLVSAHGVEHAVGLTLSKEQAAWIQSRNDRRIEVRCEHWADHRPDEPYDAVISVGAFEHFAHQGLSSADKVAAYRSFFRRCRELTAPGAWLSLQTIAYGTLRPEAASSFINEVIFPESDLPRPSEIAEAADGLFEISRMRNDRLDYASTCQAWLARLRANRKQAIEATSQEIYDRYVDYLKFSYFGFRMGKIVLLRLALQRIERARGDLAA